MNVLVVDRDHSDYSNPVWMRLRGRGTAVHVGPVETCRFAPNAVVCMGVTRMEEAFAAMALHPAARLYCYNWDVYAWVWDRPREGEYDYRRYGELLRRAAEVWVPSDCTGIRTNEWYGEGIPWRRILASCPAWDWPRVREDGYALCCLRPIPDPHWNLVEEAAGRSGVKTVVTRHGLPEDQYRDAVAGCSVIFAPLFELSTGGLSLLEAHRLGKRVLLSDSRWNGGADYFGGRAAYFRAGDGEDLGRQLRRLVREARGEGQVERQSRTAAQREWVDKNYNDARFADDIHAALVKGR